MPRLQTFEGDELDAVLAKVKSEAGVSARVLEAKKVRDGGVAGFFAKERFVLTVEVPDEAPPARRPSTAAATETAPPSSILELADLMDEAEAREVSLTTGRATYEAGRLAPLPPIAAPAPLHRGEPSGHERVVHVATERQPDPVPSTESESFQDVLRRLAHDVELTPPTAVIVDAPDADAVEDIDVSTLSFERFDVSSFAVVAEDPEPEVVVAEDPEPGVVVAEDPEPGVVVAEDPEPGVVAEGESVAVVEEAAAVPDVIEHFASELAVIDETDGEPESPPNPLVRVRRVPSTFERTVGLALLELGVPAAYVPEIEGAFTNDDVRAALMTALRLPRPPALPLGNDAIVAVLGERRAAIHLAEQLADEPALNGAIVKVADRQGFTLLDGGGASADERGVRQRPNRTVVAIPSVPGATGDWTRQLLDQLEPDMVWGVVPASRKSEDIASWAISLGGLDVLALTGMDKTVSPATSLRLGIPVGLIDGACATTEAWADLLTSRLVAA